MLRTYSCDWGEGEILGTVSLGEQLLQQIRGGTFDRALLLAHLLCVVEPVFGLVEHVFRAFRKRFVLFGGHCCHLLGSWSGAWVAFAPATSGALPHDKTSGRT